MSAWSILVSIVSSPGFAPGIFVGVVVGQLGTLILLFFMVGRDVRRERDLRKPGFKP